MYAHCPIRIVSTRLQSRPMCEEAVLLDAAHTSPSTSKTPPLRAPQALPPATVSIDNTSTASSPMLCGLPAMSRELSQRADLTTGTIVESQHLPTAACPRPPSIQGATPEGLEDAACFHPCQAGPDVLRGHEWSRQPGPLSAPTLLTKDPQSMP